MAPELAGKRAFMSAALSRDDFFPSHLQKAIDMKRGEISVGEYLFSDVVFNHEFGLYDPALSVR